MVTMPHPHEIIPVPADTDEVCCDGGQGPLGHPLTYYSLDGKTQVDCAYCGRRFVRADTQKSA